MLFQTFLCIFYQHYCIADGYIRNDWNDLDDWYDWYLTVMTGMTGVT